MSSTDHTSTGKSGRRNRKAEQRNRKRDQTQSPQPDQMQDAKEQIGITAAPADTAPIGKAARTDTTPIGADAPADRASIDAAAPADTAPIDADAPVDTVPVSFQTIANAYGDYTRKSLEETRSFVEKLSGARSLDKAMEVQTEFAKQAYETFVAQAQKIRELHSELAKQTLKPLRNLVNKTTRDPR